MKKQPPKLVEIARSFSYSDKVYGKGAEFFCSQKAEVPEKEALDASEKLYQFCKNEVVKAFQEYLAEQGKFNQVEYEKGFTAGWKEAVKPNAARKQTYEPKTGIDPNELKEVNAELGQDAKDEDGLDNGRRTINI